MDIEGDEEEEFQEVEDSLANDLQITPENSDEEEMPQNAGQLT